MSVRKYILEKIDQILVNSCVLYVHMYLHNAIDCTYRLYIMYDVHIVLTMNIIVETLLPCAWAQG